MSRKSCKQCGKGLKPIKPPQPHRKFCTPSCRLKAWRKKKRGAK